MSNEALTWAFKATGLNMTEKFVLVALADYADEQHRCYPSHAKTAARVCASKSTVQRAIKSLERKQLLEVIAWTRGNGSTTSNRYELKVGSHSDYPRSHSDQGGSQSDTRPGYPDDQGALVTSDHPNNPQLEPNSEPPSIQSAPDGALVVSGSTEIEVADAYPDDVTRLCERLQGWIVNNGARRPTITKAWKDEARRLLERDQRPLPEVVAVLDWCQQEPFWRSNILSMPKFRKQYDALRLRMGAPTSGSEQRAHRTAELMAHYSGGEHHASA